MQTKQLQRLRFYSIVFVLVNLEAFNASPAVHTAAARNKTSFAINCPGIGDRLGNPYSGCHTPGVESKKVKVIKNMIIAPKLPNAEAFGENGLAAINIPSRISITPSTMEKV